MCVAVVVESNTNLSDADLQSMARHNPDGGGVAWVSGSVVHFRKGLTWEDVAKLQAKLPRPFLLHFLIATRGGKAPELTHPFPVGLQAFDEELTGFSKAVIIHNGTWSEFNRYVPKGVDWNAVSDTQVAAYVAGWDESILDEVRWSNAIMRATDDGKADVTLRGDWTEHDGNLFSNLHWRNTYSWQGGRAATTVYQDWDEWAKEYDARQTRSRASAMGKTEPMGVATHKAPIDHKAAKISRKDAKRARRESRLAARRKGTPQCPSGFCTPDYTCLGCKGMASTFVAPVVPRREIASSGSWCAECAQRDGRHLATCSDSWASRGKRDRPVLALPAWDEHSEPQSCDARDPIGEYRPRATHPPQSDDTTVMTIAEHGDGAMEDLVDLMERRASGEQVDECDLDAALAAMMDADNTVAIPLRDPVAESHRSDPDYPSDDETIRRYLQDVSDRLS